VIARLQAGDAGADFEDNTGPFMAENGWKQPLRIGARQGELIGVADAAGLDLHQHLARLGAFKIELDDFEGLLRGKGNGGTSLHLFLRARTSNCRSVH